EIEKRLDELRHRLLRKHVLVSGSARDMPKSAEHISAFSEKLGRMLIEEDYTIVCGLNPAVGRPAINGALQALFDMGQQREVNRRILMWPRPTGHRDDRIDQLRLQYRDEMDSNSGIGLFIGGGHGTRDEYEAFRKRGGQPLPVGTFGGTAADLWREVAPSLV